MSHLLHFSEHTLQEVALAIMATVYTIRLVWLFRFKAGRERQPTTAGPDTSRRKGILYSWLNVGMPWAMESTRTKFLLYLQFVVFHLGVVAAILLSFVIPYGPGLLAENLWLVMVFQVAIGAAFLVGILRIVRRVGSPYLRAISTPDDYFSLVLLTVWFAFGVLAAPNDLSGGEWHLLAFFLLTAFFLIYVPFSKISHYLYYPITRYYFGKTMGFRGVYPIRKGPAHGA
jgi:nitrate reductase gamma subunit